MVCDNINVLVELHMNVYIYIYIGSDTNGKHHDGTYKDGQKYFHWYICTFMYNFLSFVFVFIFNFSCSYVNN